MTDTAPSRLRKNTDQATPPRLQQSVHWPYQFERFALVGALILVVLVFSLLRPGTYATSGNLAAVLGAQSVLLILSLGLLVPLTAGDMDLSVASTLSLSAMVLAVLNGQDGLGLGVSTLAALASALAVGLVNAVFVVAFRINSFIVTLGMGTLVLGVVEWISNLEVVNGVSRGLTSATVLIRIAGIPLTFWYSLALVVIVWVVFEFTPAGRRLMFVGLGRNVAALSGLRVGRIRAFSFLVSALVAGVAGVLYAGELGAADSSSGQGFLLPAFAAAYLGATAISPGRFNAIGTFVAVYFLAAGVTGLQVLGAQNFVQQLFYGGALIVAVALSNLAARQRR